MEKERKKGIALPLVLAAMALLALLSAGMLYAATASGSASADCSIAPELRLEKESITTAEGRVATVKMFVKGIQPVSCGSQVYGVDFTNGYDGKEFSLGLQGISGRNTFALSSGETHEFVGVLSPIPSTTAGDYTLQITAYNDEDHWKQVSQNIAVEVKPHSDADTYWKTPLEIGWNLIPYEAGSAAYGCDAITEAYRYSPSKKDYVEMKRFGPVFQQSDGKDTPPNERFSALFVFSRERCAIESRVAADKFLDAQVQLLGGQLLSVPPAWHGAAAESITSLCEKQGAGKVEMKKWNADSQRWENVAGADELKNGETLKAKPAKQCVLDLGQEF